jgi:hypothetical protein
VELVTGGRSALAGALPMMAAYVAAAVAALPAPYEMPAPAGLLRAG